ncbi:hypothetical protein SAMN05444156_2469 [Verrucomicrobium sp. GAS474]|nr:hypothetical protein SAMN05444156_2469 [Verrucomicrobium sp. GAS474]
MIQIGANLHGTVNNPAHYSGDGVSRPLACHADILDEFDQTTVNRIDNRLDDVFRSTDRGNDSFFDHLDNVCLFVFHIY